MLVLIKKERHGTKYTQPLLHPTMEQNTEEYAAEGLLTEEQPAEESIVEEQSAEEQIDEP